MAAAGLASTARKRRFGAHTQHGLRFRVLSICAAEDSPDGLCELWPFELLATNPVMPTFVCLPDARSFAVSCRP
jgi:hypothetical protein